MSDYDAAHLETLLLNATRPVEQFGYDGWLVRVSPKDAKRAGSAIALEAGKLPLETKISRVEAVYQGRGLGVTFRLTPMSRPEGIDTALADRGNALVEPSLVQAAPVPHDLPVSDVTDLRIEAMALGPWSEICGALHDREPDDIYRRQYRLALTRLPTLNLVGYMGAKAVVCGQSVIEGDWAGLFEIYTLESMRGRGFATALSRELMRRSRGEHGTSFSWLSVVANNKPALPVYERLGFVTVYDYWYRQKSLPDL